MLLADCFGYVILLLSMKGLGFYLIITQLILLTEAGVS